MKKASDLLLNKVCYTYLQQPLWQHLSFSVPAGHWTFLLGESGIGKTTLLKLVAQLLPMEEGTISASDGLPLDGRVAYMAQTDGLLPWLSVLDNVLIGDRLRGKRITSSRQREAQSLLERVGLGKVLDYRPGQLSGGMRSRVAIVRTWLEDKPMVVLDEPFGALDVVTRYQLQALAVEFLSGRTVLWVTHDPLEALRLADQILVLRGRPAQLVEVPLHLSTQKPRSLEDPALLALQAELLQTLSEGAL